MREIGSLTILLHRDIISIIFAFLVIYIVSVLSWGIASGFYGKPLDKEHHVG